jgi:putative two-component system response regulator
VSTLEQEQAKVLIVDDTGSSRSVAVGLLLQEGYEVIEADNGLDGIALVHQHQPDLVLLDVMMPGIDGYAVCRQLKQDENTRLIPVIFMTALEERSARIQGIEAGGDDFLTKPFDRVELSARVKSLVISIMRSRYCSRSPRRWKAVIRIRAITVNGSSNAAKALANIWGWPDRKCGI